MPNFDIVVKDPVEDPIIDPQVDKTIQEVKDKSDTKVEPGEVQPDSTKEDQKSEEEKKLLGKNPDEITKEEAVKAAQKSDEEVEKLRQRVKDLETSKIEVEDEKEEVDIDNPDVEQEAAIAALREKGYATKEEIIAELKAEQALDVKASNTVAKMGEIVDKYKDTPIKVTLEELTDYMEANRQTDPDAAFKLMKHDDIVAFEVAKATGKDPVKTESEGKEPYKPDNGTPPGMDRYNVNNPNINEVLTEELTNKEI